MLLIPPNFRKNKQDQIPPQFYILLYNSKRCNKKENDIAIIYKI